MHAFEHGDEIVEATIRNLSRFGARIDGDFNFAGPNEISLVFRGRRYPADIVWLTIGSLGLAFKDPLDKDTYVGVLGLAKRAGAKQVSQRFIMS